jgi:hypothetical protein
MPTLPSHPPTVRPLNSQVLETDVAATTRSDGLEFLNLMLTRMPVSPILIDILRVAVKVYSTSGESLETWFSRATNNPTQSSLGTGTLVNYSKIALFYPISESLQVVNLHELDIGKLGLISCQFT